MMNKMLSSSSTTIMAFHNNRFTSSSPSKSSYLPMRSTRTNAFNTIMINNNNNNGKKSSFHNDDVYSADLIGTDYFVSSLDFEYDLFLNGLVNCDNSGYRCYHRMRNQKDLQYDFSLIDAADTANHNSNYGGNNNYRDDISKSMLMPYQLMTSRRQPMTPGTTTITNNGKHNQHYNPDSTTTTTTTINTTVADNTSSILNSPSSKTSTAYRYLQKPNKHQAISNDYTSLSFGANNNKATTSGSNQNSSQLTVNQNANQAPTSVLSTSLTTNCNNINNGKINNTGQQSNKLIVLSTNGSRITGGNTGSNQPNGTNNANTNYTTITANSPNKIPQNACTSLGNNQMGKVGENCLQIPPPSSSPQPSSSVTTTTAASSLSSQSNYQSQTTISSSTVQQQPNNDLLSSQFEENIDISDNLSHQHLHALHRFRQQRKKGLISRLRDVVISYSPRARCSVLNRNDIYSRYGKEEKETLAAFDFLNEDQCNDDINGANNKEQEPVDDTNAEYQSLNQKEITSEPSPREYYSEIDLEMEEFDLTHPFTCDTINEDENENSNDENSTEEAVLAKDSFETSKNQLCKSNSNNDRFQSIETVPDSLAVTSNRLTNNNNNHSIRRFRFGFPRKSNSMEFQSTVKRLNELEDDESESFSGSHSVQETLVTGMNRSTEQKSSSMTEEVNKVPLKGRRRYFLNTASNHNNNNTNEKKKNRNKNKSKTGKLSSTLTMAINGPATMTVTE